MKEAINPLSAHSGLLSVSMVVYRPNLAQLNKTLASLTIAVGMLDTARPAASVRLYLVDNGGMPDMAAELAHLRSSGLQTSIISGHGNVGYGRGHNLAIALTEAEFHLVLNPDIDLHPNALLRAVEFFESHPEAGLLAPWIGNERGQQQFLCRRYPSLLDLFIRRIALAFVQRLFRRRLARYEMCDVMSSREAVWDPPIISGCFMMFRTRVLHALGGFDARYFLYFEDYDLSLRTHQVARVVYTPTVRILHYGGGASRKGFTHIRFFIASAVRFFCRHGWRLL